MLKIQAITPTGEWKGAHGKMFTSEVVLSDGTTGEVNSKTPDKWKVGDEVVVTSKSESNYGTKLRLSHPESNSGPRKYDPDREHIIGAAWALNAAIALKTGSEDAKGVALETLALRLLKMRDSVVEQMKDQDA